MSRGSGSSRRKVLRMTAGRCTSYWLKSTGSPGGAGGTERSWAQPGGPTACLPLRHKPPLHLPSPLPVTRGCRFRPPGWNGTPRAHTTVTPCPQINLNPGRGSLTDDGAGLGRTGRSETQVIIPMPQKPLTGMESGARLQGSKRQRSPLRVTHTTRTHARSVLALWACAQR